MEKQATKIGLTTFIGMTMALCATVRSIPSVAATGWTQITYMIFAVVFFALPVALISGELGTMMQEEGGPQLWVKTGLGEKWGFTTAWLLWVQMFPGMVMVASTIGPLWGNTIGNVSLGNNHWFILANILIFYWIITFLNLKFDMAKVGGNIGVWLGVYIPIVIMLIMGIAAMIKTGINPAGYLGTFSWHKLLPSLANIQTLQYFAAISFIYTGIEISSVFIPRLHNAAKTYTRGIFIALIGLVLMNILNGILVANVVPNGKIELSNITQPIVLWSKILGWPSIIANIFSFMVVIGVLIQLSAWVTGPSKTMTQVAREGQLPASFGYHKVNKYDVSKNVVLTQSIMISLFALLYGVMKNVNGVFLTLTNATTVIYALVYILIALSIIRLRKIQPDASRPYRLGQHGNFIAYMWAYLLIFGIAVIIVATLIASDLVQAIFVVLITVALFIAPLIIYSHKNDSWLEQVQKDLKETK
ncbi:tyrosine-tyramine antiporter [Furfurilactobacillus rossiae]|uniref:Tyrosine permease n=1 Tax=Furfurilactobacillus rossiae DSM 15814 TaxID=1114972 RepID=A0A0R1RBW3_9LACO|nr:tyrosine-tyramine antiporter [Furfurilactobacillus rossiae]KRL54479.1 tyrosine permease [Furfurilactobacillus rossiae DSM 15814]MCF6165768.1 tyrosine-tyramine antiporter [Furfurilactobacillus rossiae]QFR67404.1 amino acid permease [Furfurilactobacillus rossiae]QLE60345.1 amino acid permease protein [Furfurilactobacillus rossiae]QLE63108.1 amino acid permease protein [Furfurilactobacillus rossiae]